MIEIYTDGACSGNPGPGGFATIIRLGDHEQVLTGTYHTTTNNRMELMAIIAGCEFFSGPEKFICFSDSQYALSAINAGWLTKWQRNGWKTSIGRNVKNQDLWIRLSRAIKPHIIVWEWVRGHSGHPMNERVDKLAVRAVTGLSPQKDIGYETSIFSQ